MEIYKPEKPILSGTLLIYLFTLFNVVYKIVENSSTNKYQQNQVKI